MIGPWSGIRRGSSGSRVLYLVVLFSHLAAVRAEVPKRGIETKRPQAAWKQRRCAGNDDAMPAHPALAPIPPDVCLNYLCVAIT